MSPYNGQVGHSLQFTKLVCFAGQDVLALMDAAYTGSTAPPGAGAEGGVDASLEGGRLRIEGLFKDLLNDENEGLTVGPLPHALHQVHQHKGTYIKSLANSSSCLIGLIRLPKCLYLQSHEPFCATHSTSVPCRKGIGLMLTSLLL